MKSWLHLVLFSLMICLLTACGSASPVPGNTSSSTNVNSQAVPLHVWVTNQALLAAVKTVQMTVSLDGQVIFDKSMDVGDQDNYATIDQNVSTGSHTITVKVGNPYTLSMQKNIDVSDERWVIAAFWLAPQGQVTDPQGPQITIDVFDVQPGIQ